MAFPLRDVRFTSRRGGGSDPTIFPRLLRDRSILPKVDIAIQYFETMLGRERRDFETEVLVHFFGDHKLARCMVACLARSYRFRSPPLAEVVTRGGLRRLSRAGIDSPRGLRFRVFDQVNDFGHGFLPGSEREAAFGRLETELALRPGELERLLDLDSEERAVLMRVGAEAKPADVVAQYNFGVLESLLRHAAWIQLRLSEATPETTAGIAQLCALNDFDAELQRVGGGLQVRLAGRQDALGVWARHGRRVARSLVQVLERGRATVVDGEAEVAIRDRRAQLRLTPEALDF